MKKQFKKEVLEGLERTNQIKKAILTENDLRDLPPLVQKYLRYVGVVGKDKVKNFRVEFEGKIRGKPGDSWMKLTSRQYNFTDKPTRVFYIKARKMGIPATGIHLYKEGKAIMLIKLAGLFTISDAKGKEMDQGETVTVFNDMCFMAPATLIDKNIVWEEVDALSVKATYTNGNISISAVLYFNEKGEMINFISNDRFETQNGKEYKNYPWITPAFDYTETHGYRLASGARVIYRHPGEDFCYGEFNTTNVEYNCKEF